MKVPNILVKSLLSVVVCSALLSGEIISKSINTKKTDSVTSSTKKVDKKHATHWGYTGHAGPENWGLLSDEHKLCKDGKSQSPINITKSVTVQAHSLEEIGFDYKTSISSVINNGHTIQVNFDEGSSITVDEIKFPLIQFHFHTPSENQINGEHFPLEGHFVHATKDGSLAVVALMFEDGLENPFLKKVWAKMPKKGGEKESLDIPASEVNALLPKDKGYYRFDGSLTTPPCSEGVRWMVLKNYTTISKEQTKEFLDLFEHNNNRPIQPINARKVVY
ncbi:carbonic anhydrase [Sulfurimonas sp.]|uniref:carbonic anhydrase n=1 Tax=Sulfurimonas sp. TaxID=2022749 RepID=UPI0025E72E0A|nr:carbonic anhydrase family protein [Sulfurimonas sp.]MDD5156887.1 carbonic anhydrase family protein [Sulfurimonas sp.]